MNPSISAFFGGEDALRWTDLLSLLRHDHRWENLTEGLTGGRA